MPVAGTRARGGVHFEATLVETPVQLERPGSALGEHLGVGRLAFDDWGEALDRLLRLPVDDHPMDVPDEFGRVLEADRSVESVLAKALGPGSGDGRRNARPVLCGSAISVMRALTAGQAPLGGRAGLELPMQPDDFRTAASRLPNPDDLALAVAVFSVIGGVVGYATEMTNVDLPTDVDDVDRRVIERVSSPAAPLHHEATTLLAEDPALAGTSALLRHGMPGATGTPRPSRSPPTSTARRSRPRCPGREATEPMRRRRTASTQASGRTDGRAAYRMRRSLR